MVITYHGGECFKASYGDTTIAFNPISKESKLPSTKFGANVAFITLKHSDFNGAEQVAFGDRQPFVASGPGEYEVGEVTARGFGVRVTYKGRAYINTIYQVTLEGITMVFLGPLSSPDIEPSIVGALSNTDILFVPIGGTNGKEKDEGLLTPAEASAFAVKLEPHAVIPMHFDDATLKEFRKEEGSTAKSQEKFTVKKKDLALMEGEIVVLK